MPGFCNNHVGDRSPEELRERITHLEQRGMLGNLSAHLSKELTRCKETLKAKESEASNS